MDRTVAVTGGSGKLGRAVVAALIDEGWTVGPSSTSHQLASVDQDPARQRPARCRSPTSQSDSRVASQAVTVYLACHATNAAGSSSRHSPQGEVRLAATVARADMG
jgi:NAD(P)-dependent dehydrogenase (short-subunit alcohol dehydrogenase family)